MRSAIRSTLIALPFLLSAAAARAFDTADRLVDPTERVGAVMEDTSEADLMRVYGSTAVTRAEDRDDKTPTTILFAGSPDEVRIEWKNEYRSPRRIIVNGERWKTVDGLAVGTPLEEIIRVNDGPFDVTGSNWDRPVRVVSWKGGHLPPSLQIDLSPADPHAGLPKQLRSRRAFFESTSPTLQKAHLVIKRLILEW